ncbi:hypothetical protein Tco_0982656 [Tanacetum coccineum]
MSAPKFVDSHNMVAFLAKPTESDEFEQILDILNANPIKYALMVNPTIYTSCIEQFWATAKVKTINGEVQLQALVDGKNVIITETSVRRDLQLEDDEGIECLPNADIFKQLALMGMVKNSSVKFLMYPRFVQVFLDKQVGNMSTHDEIFVIPSHIKKVFGNMKRVGKGFSRAVTPLFPTMMVQAQEEIGEGSAMPTDPHHTPIIQPSTSQPQKKQSRRKQRKDTEITQSSGPTEPIADEAANEENIPTQSNDPPLSRVNTPGSGEDRLKLKELIDLCTKLSDRVLDLETTKTAQEKDIASLKKREDASKQGRKIDDIDQDVEVTLVDETQGRYDDAKMFDTDVFNGEEVFVAKQIEKVVEEVVSTAEVSVAATITTEEITLAQALAKLRSAKPKVVVQDPVLQVREQEELIDEEKARLFIELLEKRKKHYAALRAQEKRNKPPTKAQKKSTMSTYLKHMASYKQSQLKNKSFTEIQKLFDKAMTRVNMFVDKDTELVKESSKKAEAEMAQEIHRKGRNGYYEIMRADGSAKTYLLFSQLLKEFDREDLENLWKLVKAKQRNTRPEEGYKRVLWGDLKIVFEHHVEDLIWRNLQGKKVWLWKLYDSCGIHVVRFEDMHVYILVKKRYPLTPATITDMLNKKLQAGYWNEMCYQLLKLMTKQLKKQ